MYLHALQIDKFLYIWIFPVILSPPGAPFTNMDSL